MDKSQKYYSKKLKYGGLSVATTAIVIAIVVAANIIVSMMMQRSALKIDLTKQKLYQLSPATEKYVSDIKDEVDIVVTANEYELRDNTYYNYIAELLDKYASFSDKVKVSYVNVIDEPDKIAKYQKLYATEIGKYQVIVSSGGKIKVGALDNLFQLRNDATGTPYPVGLNVENVITPQIMYVTDANTKKIAFYAPGVTQASSQPQYYYAVSTLYGLLTENAFDVEDVDLLTLDLSPDVYDIVLATCLPSDLPVSVTEKIDTFLNNGGKFGRAFIYVSDIINNIPTVNLDAYLEQWGLRLGKEVVLEEDDAKAQTVMTTFGGSAYPFPVGYIGDDAYKAGLSNAAKPIVMPYSRPVYTLWEDRNSRATAALLSSSVTGYAWDGTQDNYTPSDGSSLIGSYNTVAVSTRRPEVADENSMNSAVLVFGSPYFTDPYITQNTAYINGEFVINTINILVGKESTAYFSTKTFDNTPINVSDRQIKNIRFVVVFLIPAVVVAVGVAVFVKRRNK